MSCLRIGTMNVHDNLPSRHLSAGFNLPFGQNGAEVATTAPYPLLSIASVVKDSSSNTETLSLMFQ
jgi:hypothetical protein